ncbi:aromatic amino acid lyase, partial [Staphylococcus aureus]|uniref:aromatic amino acid lyase n=1 Tax=Staphylococcus aureus TaxID=1280 RepID=UPI0016426B5D
SQPPLHPLLNPQLNPHLPPFLTPHPPFQTGAIIIQYPPPTLLSQNKTLPHPPTLHSITSSPNQQHHLSIPTTPP